MKQELTLLRDFPIITAKLCIDQLELNDLDDLFGLMSLTAIQEFIPERFKTKEELKQTLEWLISNYSMKKHEVIRITLGIRLKEGKKLVGWISYGPLPYNESLKEIAYAIDPTYWNLGYATAAGKAFLQWLFKNMADGDTYAQVNPSSGKIGNG